MLGDLKGKTFLDVGCWAGNDCVSAMKAGAKRAVGVDMCISEGLHANIKHHGIEFIQMDIFSEKFLSLPQFDVVRCGGVLYHVENVMSLLIRLRKVTKERLILETVINNVKQDMPVLLFHPADSLKKNPSNWWTPNRLCLRAMLNTAGFSRISTLHEEKAGGLKGFDRITVQAIADGEVPLEKVAPRRLDKMEIAGGKRIGDKSK